MVKDLLSFTAIPIGMTFSAGAGFLRRLFSKKSPKEPEAVADKSQLSRISWSLGYTLGQFRREYENSPSHIREDDLLKYFLEELEFLNTKIKEGVPYVKRGQLNQFKQLVDNVSESVQKELFTQTERMASYLEQVSEQGYWAARENIASYLLDQGYTDDLWRLELVTMMCGDEGYQKKHYSFTIKLSTHLSYCATIIARNYIESANQHKQKGKELEKLLETSPGIIPERET